MDAVDAARRHLDRTGDEGTFQRQAGGLNARIRRYNDQLPAAGSMFGVPPSSTAFRLFMLSIPGELAGSAERRRP